MSLKYLQMLSSVNILTDVLAIIVFHSEVIDCVFVLLGTENLSEDISFYFPYLYFLNYYFARSHQVSDVMILHINVPAS